MAEPTPGGDLTEILQQWRAGDADALERLMPVVYGELKRIASRHMYRERVEHTLQTTALVNEAYLKLMGTRETRWNDRAHFYAISAQLMRRILVDHARASAAEKRGGGADRVSLEAAEAELLAEQPVNILDLNQALEKLGEFDELKSRIIELRYFGGLTLDETATIVELSRKQVWQESQLAQAWLLRELAHGGASGP
ncbi:MAG: sigma-70 family RNA polymerase sigma factor [Planctomycetota bacterium]